MSLLADETTSKWRLHRYVFSTTTECVEDKKATVVRVKEDLMYSLAVRRPDVFAHEGHTYTSEVGKIL